LIQLRKTPSSLITVALLCFGLLPRAQAVVPAPDGGYPGQNTAEGQNALLNLNVNNGTNNTAVGWWALRTNVDGDFNTAIGSAALATNTGDGNTAVGGAALFSNTTGDYNMAAGLSALFHNTAGLYNTALGASTLQSNHQGVSNTAAGYQALYVNDSSGNVERSIAFDESNQGLGLVRYSVIMASCPKHLHTEEQAGIYMGYPAVSFCPRSLEGKKPAEIPLTGAAKFRNIAPRKSLGVSPRATPDPVSRRVNHERKVVRITTPPQSAK